MAKPSQLQRLTDSRMIAAGHCVSKNIEITLSRVMPLAGSREPSCARGRIRVISEGAQKILHTHARSASILVY